MADVFDPTARDVARVKLLGHVYEVAEFGAKRLRRMEKLQAKLRALDEKAPEKESDGELDEADLEAVRHMCEMVEISVVKGDSLGGRLWDAFHLDDEDLGEDDDRRGVTMEYLVRLTQFLAEQQGAQQAVGEG
jgi:hypothetical protein